MYVAHEDQFSPVCHTWGPQADVIHYALAWESPIPNHAWHLLSGD